MDAMKKRLSRREALGILGAAGAALAACGESPVSPTTVTRFGRDNGDDRRHIGGVRGHAQ
jgi:hypothetical protein